MIICFTGTGNSRRVAYHLRDILGDEVLRISPGLMQQPELIMQHVEDGRVIWVFPIFSWGLPKITENVLKKAKFRAKGTIVHHMVATCGDDIGYADKLWRDILSKRKMTTGSAFSVQMPNTYTLLPGFDVDSPEVTKAKLDAEPARTDYIASRIKSHDKPIVEVVRGRFPLFKTHVLRPLFNCFLTSTKQFPTTDNCGGCGHCARNCPVNGITIEKGIPTWNGQCTMCLRCYHCCPRHAVRYGISSEGKGQYLCPDFKLKS